MSLHPAQDLTTAPSPALVPSPDALRRGLQKDLRDVVIAITNGEQEDIETITYVLEQMRCKSLHQLQRLVAHTQQHESKTPKEALADRFISKLLQDKKITTDESPVIHALLQDLIDAVCGTPLSTYVVPHASPAHSASSSSLSSNSLSGSNKRTRVDSSPSSVASTEKKFPAEHLKSFNPAHEHFWRFLLCAASLCSEGHASEIACVCGSTLHVHQGFNYLKHLHSCHLARGLLPPKGSPPSCPVLPRQQPHRNIIDGLLALKETALLKIPAIFLAALPPEVIPHLPHGIRAAVLQLSEQHFINQATLPQAPPPPPAAAQPLNPPVNAMELNEEPIPNVLVTGESFGSSVSQASSLSSVFRAALGNNNDR